MTVTVTTFRAQYPEFANAAVYSDARITIYLTFATAMIRPDRWGGAGSALAPNPVYDMGIAAFTAHWLTMAQLAASNPGGMAGVPGTAVGIINQGHVDKVSYGKDVMSAVNKDAGHWNMSIYGAEFWQLMRMMGMGPIQLGIGITPPGFIGGVGGWPGVLVPFADGGGDGWGIQ